MAVHGDRQSAIKFNKLEEILKSQGKNWNYLRTEGISPGIVQKMKESKGDINTKTIETICALLNCQPGDFMEYIPEPQGED